MLNQLEIGDVVIVLWTGRYIQAEILEVSPSPDARLDGWAHVKMIHPETGNWIKCDVAEQDIVLEQCHPQMCKSYNEGICAKGRKNTIRFRFFESVPVCGFYEKKGD